MVAVSPLPRAYTTNPPIRNPTSPDATEMILCGGAQEVKRNS